MSWAFVGMAGVAALGLHLLGADQAGSLGPMTAAVVALAVGGSVSPSGDVDAFGISPGSAEGGFDIMPLGVSVVGAVLLAWVFLRALRRARSVTAGELAARVGCTVLLFLGVLGGLAWAGHDTIAIDGASLGDIGGGDGEGPLGDLPIDDLPGLGDLAEAGTSVGFRANITESLVGGLVWVLVVLLIALLASRRTPVPPGWEFLHRVVRPAVSALCTVLAVAVAAGAAAGAYAAVTGDEPGRIIGGVLVGAPNGVWLAVPLGLFVPWDGSAKGQLAEALPSPLDELLTGRAGESITLSRLAELDGRVWLLPVAVGLMMLTAGVLSAARTPLGAGGLRPGRQAVVNAVRLGLATAVVLPLLVWLTGVRVDANVSVFGFDAVGAGLELNGSLPAALLLGGVWGAAAGLLGALLASATGAAGRRAAAVAQPAAVGQQVRVPVGTAAVPETGPYRPNPAYRPDPAAPNPYGAEPNPYRDGPGPYQPNPAQRADPAEPNPYRDEPNPYKDPPGPAAAAGGVSGGETGGESDTIPETRWPHWDG